ncbi:GGDEF domain-containing protein [Salinicola halimionae]|uniref:GGDEF domain-containing protein n=1 Tax=Salinicola halimionae TaxID=1949081 RepID=UPI000DA20AC4|nr:GGDEF domain-containing protein [Salinicola halimionae]
MISIEQMALVLDALPDPAFILSRSGKYVAVFGGRDARYYHDGSGLVGLYISDVVEKTKADWFLEQIKLALESGNLLVKEYELSNKEVDGVPEEGPQQPIWFEGRVQGLDFLVDGEAVVLWVASNISERHEMEIKLRELSETDQLTGLYNRRKLESELALHYEAFERHSVPTSILMLDLDNFKKINDTLGHHAGDKMIKAVGSICLSELRQTDIPCRLGGDEFVIGLPNIELEHAIQLADRLRESFNGELSQFHGEGFDTTVSIGVAAMLPADRSYEDTLKRADSALYDAKRSGRNRVVAGMPQYPPAVLQNVVAETFSLHHPGSLCPPA